CTRGGNYGWFAYW
nr:immunoglobulin heavy chain junction region [Mus musculus]